MATGMQQAAGSREQACMLCGKVDEDSDILGPMQELNGSYFHAYCAMFANGLCQREVDKSYSFVKQDLIRTVEQTEETNCIVCGKMGASITCAHTGCDRSFHLPCAWEGECVTQYFDAFRSFCWEHRPLQEVQAVPVPESTCIMCMDPVGDSISYSTMVCPCCQQAWFHRACVQKQALCAGIYSFKCPLCRDRVSFFKDMRILGIRIPVRGPIWENDDAYASEHERHRRCDSSECHFRGGREQAQTVGPWELLLCSSCAAQGTHRHCSNVDDSTSTWECNVCAAAGSNGLRRLRRRCRNAAPDVATQGTSESSSAGPQIPQAGPEDAAGAGTQQPRVLRAAPTAAANGQHQGPAAAPQRLKQAGAHSQGGPGLEAALVSDIMMQSPAGLVHTTGAGPVGQSQPGTSQPALAMLQDSRVLSAENEQTVELYERDNSDNVFEKITVK
ncbi:PHD finger protein 7-like [Cyrtonyx montezumae]|uniref:PHD finger protein 7-like n=1 Tax=Cyrtonyx montezumae TaxID=9017 RepID=UPI0032DAB9A4